MRVTAVGPGDEPVDVAARTDLKSACDRARALVAAQPDDEDAAWLLRQAVERLVRETPPRPDEAAALPAPLAEAMRLLSAEQDEPAEIILRRYLAEHRNDVRAMAMMAEIAARCDLFDNARKILQRALEIEPGSVDALLTLARLVKHVGFVEQRDRGEEALEIIDRILTIDPHNAVAVSLQSSILVRYRRLAESIASFERLLDLDPVQWLAWANFGQMLSSLGRFGDAVAALRTAAAINPLSGVAWWELANLKISTLFAGDVAQMEAVLADAALDPAARSQIHFALAKAYHQDRRFAEAAEQLAHGNAIKRRLQPDDPQQISADVDESERIFTPDFFAQRRGQGDPRPDPIFIVGIQRSGTTLVEQILASHSAIEGTEELFVILQLATELADRNPGLTWQQALARARPDVLHALGEGFLRLAQQYRSSERPFFIDKNPANWRFTGLIAAILPNAKIIDVRRDPMDCCFANYAQHYENGVGFSYSQTGLGRYYADYVRLMRHFDRIAPGQVHRLVYEDLVDDLEGNVRRLLEFLGLPFEPECLRFFETERAVLTPSAQQVRQPINRSGIGRWRSYEPWLGELRQALGTTLDDWRN